MSTVKRRRGRWSVYMQLHFPSNSDLLLRLLSIPQEVSLNPPREQMMCACVYICTSCLLKQTLHFICATAFHLNLSRLKQCEELNKFKAIPFMSKLTYIHRATCFQKLESWTPTRVGLHTHSSSNEISHLTKPRVIKKHSSVLGNLPKKGARNGSVTSKRSLLRVFSFCLCQ